MGGGGRSKGCWGGMGSPEEMGQPGRMGTQLGWDTQECGAPRQDWALRRYRAARGGWGAPSPFPCSLGEGCRAAERQHLCLQGKEGVNWLRIPPSLLNSLIHFLCSYFFLSLSSSLSCRLIKNSLSLKVFVSKQLRCQLGAKQWIFMVFKCDSAVGAKGRAS